MLKSHDLLNGMKHTVRSKGKEIDAVRMECKQEGRTTQPESCLSLLRHPPLLMIWFWGTQFKEVHRQKMAETTQFMLHSRDPEAIKLMSKYRFYLQFLGRELVGLESLLSMGSQFKPSWLLKAASYRPSTSDVSVPCVYLMNDYYLYLLGAPLYLFLLLMCSVYFTCLWYLIGY